MTDLLQTLKASKGLPVRDTAAMLIGKKAALPVIYGWHVDQTVSDPSQAVTYLKDARGKTPAAMGENAFSYGDWENAFFMPRPCMLRYNGTVAYYLDPDDYTKKLDGTPSDIADPDFDGNAMMEWPLIWYKFSSPEENGFRRLEYIKSTGTQYVDTDICVSSYTDFSCILDASFETGSGSEANILGTRNTAGDECFSLNLGIDHGSPNVWDAYVWAGFKFIDDQYPLIKIGSPNLSARSRIKIKYGDTSWGNITCSNTPSITGNALPSYPIRIFGRNSLNPTVLSTHKMCFYSAKFYENNALIHDLVPVERVSDNVIGLYDIITERFYPEGGSQSFVKGNYIASDERVFYCSNTKADKSFRCLNNINADGRTKRHFYTAVYNGTGTAKLRSLSGVSLTAANGSGGTTVDQETGRAAANNATVKPEWYTDLWSDRILINALLVLIGRSFDTQSVFGKGLISASQSDYTTGGLNDKGLFYGSTGSTSQPVKVFGMENWWGCKQRRTAGLVGLADNKYAVKLTYSRNDGSSTEGYNSDGTGYIQVSDRPASGIIGQIQHTSCGPLPIRTITSGGFCPDRFVTGTGYALCGGDPESGGNAGAFSLDISSSGEAADENISASLSCKPC